MFGGGHEPSAGIVGDSGLRPAFKSGDECVLSEVFGEADVADDAGEGGDEAGGLDAPDGVDGAMDVLRLGCTGDLHQDDETIFGGGEARRPLQKIS